jgi:hypothetical protein
MTEFLRHVWFSGLVLYWLSACGGRLEAPSEAQGGHAASADSTSTSPAAGGAVSDAGASSIGGPPCETGTTVLVRPSSYVVDLAQDEQRLYLRTREDIIAVTKDGGTVETLVPSVKCRARHQTQEQGQLAVGDGFLYWIDESSALWRKGVNGQPTELLLGSGNSIRFVYGLSVVDHRFVYGIDGDVYVANSTGVFAPILLARGVFAFIADADGIYHEDFDDTGTSRLHWVTWDGRDLNLGLIGSDHPCPLRASGRYIDFCHREDSGNIVLRRRDKLDQIDEMVTDFGAMVDDSVMYSVVAEDIYFTWHEGLLYHTVLGQQMEPDLLSQQVGYDDDNYAGLMLVDDESVYWEARIDSLPIDDDAPLPILRSCR